MNNRVMVITVSAWDWIVLVILLRNFLLFTVHVCM